MQLTITDVADVPDVSQDIDTYPREVKYVCKGRRPIGLLIRYRVATPNNLFTL